jgi:hypothetical protein
MALVPLGSCGGIVLSAVETTGASGATSSQAGDVGPRTHLLSAVIVTCLLELCYPVRHEERRELSDEFPARVVSFLT